MKVFLSREDVNKLLDGDQKRKNLKQQQQQQQNQQAFPSKATAHIVLLPGDIRCIDVPKPSNLSNNNCNYSVDDLNKLMQTFKIVDEDDAEDDDDAADDDDGGGGGGGDGTCINSTGAASVTITTAGDSEGYPPMIVSSKSGIFSIDKIKNMVASRSFIDDEV